MVLNLAQKKAIVAEVSDVANEALAAVVAEYRGLTVVEMTALRQKAREANVHLQIVRNTLAKLALKESEFNCLDEVLVGPVILAFAKDAPGAAARLIKDFIDEDHENLKVKALALGGQLLAASELGKIAKLPTRDEAIASLMSVMKAPITKFVQTVAEPHAKLARTLAAVRDSKQAA